MRVLQLLCAGLIGACAAATVRGSLQPTTHLDAVTTGLSPSTVLRLTAADGRREYTTTFLTSGEFVFYDVPPAEYVLRVICGSHVFKPVKVIVSSSSSSSTQEGDEEISAYRRMVGRAWSDPTMPLPYPLVLGAEGVVEYYRPRPSLDLLAILRQPMVLLGLFMAVSLFGLPALTKYLDPDGIEEMEQMKREKAEQQRTARADAPVIDNPVEKLTNFDVSGWLAGKK